MQSKTNIKLKDIFISSEEEIDGDKMNTRWGGFIDAIDEFDASFFEISPRALQKYCYKSRKPL